MARDPNFKIKYFVSQNCSEVVPFIKNHATSKSKRL